MRIDHVAIWVEDIELMKSFYVKYFNATPNDKYMNKANQFESYFLQFEGKCRIELMKKPDIKDRDNNFPHQTLGLIHLAISVGSKDSVDMMTQRLREDGYKIVSLPRTTGDGYYESGILDPENNLIEITV